MIVVTRFEVPEADADGFARRAGAALAVLAERPGFLTGDLGQNLDEPHLWTVVTRWRDVGSYRRALQGDQAKMTVVPLLSLAVDEPSAYEDPRLVGDNVARDTDVAR